MTSSPTSSSPTSSSPVYCRCTHKLRATGWTSQFARLIAELNDSALRPSQLRQVEKFIRFDVFICKSKDSELNAAQALLTLWAKLLAFVQRWWQTTVTASPSTLPSNSTSPAPAPLVLLPTFHPSPLTLSSPSTTSPSSPSAPPHPRLKDLRVVFELLDHLINRHEFDLIHLIPPPSSPPSTLTSLSSASSSNRMYRAQSMTVPPRGAGGNVNGRFAATEYVRERGSSGGDRYGYGGGGGRWGGGGGDSSTVPSSPSSSHHHSHGSKSPPAHPTYLSAAEQLHLIQSYRTLLTQTVQLVLKMVRESSEGRAEMQQQRSLSSHSSTASFFSSTLTSTSSSSTHGGVAGDSVGEAWGDVVTPDSLLRRVDVTDANELNDALRMPDQCKVVEADGELEKGGGKAGLHGGGDGGDAVVLSDAEAAAEKEAMLEKKKVEAMKPELTVDCHLTNSQAILDPLLPLQSLSPLSATSPLSPLSPSASTLPSPTSSSHSLSSLAASSSSSLSSYAPSLLSRPDFVWFSGRLLAIVFFRLPHLSGTLLDSLSHDSPTPPPLPSHSTPPKPTTDTTTPRKASTDGSWRDVLRLQVDDWARRQAESASGLKKSPSISTLSNLLSLTSSTTASSSSSVSSTKSSLSSSSSSLSSQVEEASADLSLTRSITLPPALPSPPPLLSSVSARSQRSLTSAFLHANPSFFEWTKPELNRDTHHHHHHHHHHSHHPSDPPQPVDDDSRGSDHQPHSTTTHNDDDGYGSGAADVSGGGLDEGGVDDDFLLSPLNVRCLKLLMAQSSIFFTFSAAWMSHVHHTTNPIHAPPVPSPLPPFISAEKQEQQLLHSSAYPHHHQPSHPHSPSSPSDGIMWDLIPGYRLLLHTTLKRLILLPITPTDDEDDDTEIDPTDVPALSPLIDPDLHRRTDDRRDEKLLAQLRREMCTSCQTYILNNPASRAACLGWLTEVELRHTAVRDKRGVEKTLDALDQWYTLFLQPEVGRKMAISIDGAFAHHHAPHYPRLSHHLPSPLTAQHSLPWLSSSPTTFLAQQRERCMRARVLQRQAVANPSMSYPFPPSYCTPLLITALSILLAQEHFQVLLKTLTFIYMHTGHFTADDRTQLAAALLAPPTFPRLFFHWCAEIRRVFHSILVYRLLRDGRMPTVVPGGVVGGGDQERRTRTITIVIDGKDQHIPVIDVHAPPSSPSTPHHSTTLSSGFTSPSSSLASPASPSPFTDSSSSSPLTSPVHPPPPSSPLLSSSSSPPSSPSHPLPRKLSAPKSINEPRPSHSTLSTLSVGWWTRLGASLLSLVDPSFAAYDPSILSATAAVSPATNPPDPSPATTSVVGMSRSMSDHHMEEQRGRPGGGSTASHHARRSSAGVVMGGGHHGEELEDVLKPDDPSLDTCCIVRSRMDAQEQDVDRRVLHMLDACLTAAHQQYHMPWPVSSLAQPQPSPSSSLSPSPSPSLRFVPSTPPCSDVLVYQPHLATYASAAFREFRALLATFRRVQSQLSPSLAVPASTTPDHCLLPGRGGGGEGARTKAMNGVRGGGGEGGKKSEGGAGLNGVAGGGGHGCGGRKKDGSGVEGGHDEGGYEGVVIVPQLYYAVPQP